MNWMLFPAEGRNLGDSYEAAAAGAFLRREGLTRLFVLMRLASHKLLRCEHIARLGNSVRCNFCQHEPCELLRPPLQVAQPRSTFLLPELREYGFRIVLRERIEACSPRRGVGEMSRFAHRSFDGNPPSLCLLQVGKICALGARPLGLTCTRYVASCVCGETMRGMDATDFSPTAPRAVASVGGAVHCTECKTK